jgi:hypothetical protein
MALFLMARFDKAQEAASNAGSRIDRNNKKAVATKRAAGPVAPDQGGADIQHESSRASRPRSRK